MPAVFFNAPNMAGYSVPNAPVAPQRQVYQAPVTQGQLPFAAAAPALPTNAAGLASAYQQTYGNALNFNKANYENILAGYQQTVAAQNAGYQNLYADVMGTISNMEAGRAQAIQDSTRAEIGGATQSLIDRGLGNTTVQQTVVSGANANRDRRLTELSGEMAGIRGGYQAQLGQAHLQSLAGLQSQQLQWMNSVNAPYPDAGLYAQLAQQYGAAQAADEAARRMAQAAQPGALPGGTGVGGRLGYTPPGRSMAAPAGAQTMPATGGGWSMFAQAPAATVATGYGGAYGSALSGVGSAVAPAYGTAIGSAANQMLSGWDNAGNEYGNAVGMTGGAVNSGAGGAIGAVGAQRSAMSSLLPSWMS